MQYLSVDIVGPINPPSKSGFRYILVFIDWFSKYAIAEPLVNIDAKACAQVFINRVVAHHGVPQYLLSDRGSQFVSALLKEVLVLLNTQPLYTTAYHAQTNGLVERFNGTLIQILSTLCNVVVDDWSDMLQPALFAYNTSTQATLEENPFFIVHGRDAVAPGESMLAHRDFLYGSTTDYINELQDRLSATYQYVKQVLKAAQDKYLAQNTNLRSIPSYEPGELVWILLPSFTLKAGKASKFVHPWIGPYVVQEKRSDVVYRVYKADSTPEKTTMVVNITRMKPCKLDDSRKQIIFNPPTAGDVDAMSAESIQLLELPQAAPRQPASASRRGRSPTPRPIPAFVPNVQPVPATVPAIVPPTVPATVPAIVPPSASANVPAATPVSAAAPASSPAVIPALAAAASPLAAESAAPPPQPSSADSSTSAVSAARYV
jgi:hypothetical protein